MHFSNYFHDLMTIQINMSIFFSKTKRVELQITQKGADVGVVLKLQISCSVVYSNQFVYCFYYLSALILMGLNWLLQVTPPC